MWLDENNLVEQFTNKSQGKNKGKVKYFSKF